MFLLLLVIFLLHLLFLTLSLSPLPKSLGPRLCRTPVDWAQVTQHKQTFTYVQSACSVTLMMSLLYSVNKGIGGPLPRPASPPPGLRSEVQQRHQVSLTRAYLHTHYTRFVQQSIQIHHYNKARWWWWCHPPAPGDGGGEQQHRSDAPVIWRGVCWDKWVLPLPADRGGGVWSRVQSDSEGHEVRRQEIQRGQPITMQFSLEEFSDSERFSGSNRTGTEKLCLQFTLQFE